MLMQGAFMPHDSFQLACDRISQGVDGAQFERLRWAKHEGPMLAALVALAHEAIAERGEFELTEEGATNDIKRFVLKVHGFRVMAIVLWLDNGRAVINAEAVTRGKYSIAPGEPMAVDFPAADASWMAASLQALFGRIEI